MKPERLLAITATVVIVSAVIGGLILIEGPGSARAERFDQERMNNLTMLASYIDDQYYLDRTMPEDLSPFVDENDFERTSTDPRSDLPYEYERLSENSYRLCAAFETDAPHTFSTYSRTVLFAENSERHVEPRTISEAGRQCFDITIVEKS